MVYLFVLGPATAQDSSDNNLSNVEDNYDANMALPSTSTGKISSYYTQIFLYHLVLSKLTYFYSLGYRGQSTSALFRITEVDSDDDQSVSSRPISPRNQNGPNIPNNLVSIIPTPINGSRDSLGDSLRVEPPESESSPPPENRHRMNLRRVRRNGRVTLQRSDSSESPPPKDPSERAAASVAERLSPKQGYNNRTIARLMNETNESELESSCSTEGSSLWPAASALGTPDSGVGTVVGSSTRRSQPAVDDVSDDPDYQAHKFRQRVKKARRNYRTHMDSDSN